jgi:hypothetical protein
MAGIAKNDKEYLAVQALTWRKIQFTGSIADVLIMTPHTAKNVSKIPRRLSALYKFDQGLTREVISRSQYSAHYEFIALNTGFPSSCAKCGKAIAKYNYFVGYAPNGNGVRMRHGTYDDAAKQQETNDQKKFFNNVRDFMAIPCCDEHNFSNSVFYSNKVFYTDDEELVKNLENNGFKFEKVQKAELNRLKNEGLMKILKGIGFGIILLIIMALLSLFKK